MQTLFGDRPPKTKQDCEFTRIAQVPRVSEYDPAEVEWLHVPGSGIRLFELQMQALACIQKCRGFMGAIPVGFGKTLIAWLAPVVLKARRPVIFVPSNMREEFRDEVNKFRHAFVRGIRDPEVISYTKLSSKNSTGILEEMRPDLIICDEAHTLRNKDSSRTKRIERYIEANPDTILIIMTGTLIDKKVSDLQNLAKYCLGHHNTFIPLDDHAFGVFQRTVDLDAIPAGADWPIVRQFARSEGFDFDLDDTVEHKQYVVRAALQNRMFTTPGVLGSEAASVDTPLNIIRVFDVPVPADIQYQIDTLEVGGETPDGDDIILEDAQKARVGKTLSLGFFTRWAWETIGGRNEDWLLARKVWGRELRSELKERSDVGYDSPALVRGKVRADCFRPEQDRPKMQDIHRAYQGWMPLEDAPEPPTVPVWRDPFAFTWLSQWLSQQTRPTIVWYESTAAGEALAAIGLRVYGRGSSKPVFKGQHVACSIKVHGTGKNMQDWACNIVIEPPSSNKTWEQLIGRTHRRHQKADRVDVYVLQHTQPYIDCFDSALKDADYTKILTRCEQRLRIATMK